MALITFEGVDGSGKSTQATRLVERLQVEGHEVVQVREPGGTPLGEAVRTLLLDPDSSIEPFAEMMLFSAARAQLCRTVIEPALARGAFVIADRFFDSTTVYQGIARGLGSLGWMADFHLQVTGGLVPLRTYILDVPADVATRRRWDASSTDDRIEAAGRPFLERVVEGYRRLADQQSERIRLLDGTRAPDVLAEDIWADASQALRTVHSQ
jgi:dTMP kinase